MTGAAPGSRGGLDDGETRADAGARCAGARCAVLGRRNAPAGPGGECRRRGSTRWGGRRHKRVAGSCRSIDDRERGRLLSRAGAGSERRIVPGERVLRGCGDGDVQRRGRGRVLRRRLGRDPDPRGHGSRRHIVCVSYVLRGCRQWSIFGRGGDVRRGGVVCRTSERHCLARRRIVPGGGSMLRSGLRRLGIGKRGSGGLAFLGGLECRYGERHEPTVCRGLLLFHFVRGRGKRSLVRRCCSVRLAELVRGAGLRGHQPRGRLVPVTRLVRSRWQRDLRGGVRDLGWIDLVGLLRERCEPAQLGGLPDGVAVRGLGRLHSRLAARGSSGLWIDDLAAIFGCRGRGDREPLVCGLPFFDFVLCRRLWQRIR